VADYAPEVKKALQAAGWRYDRPGKGDHEVWVNPTTGCGRREDPVAPHSENLDCDDFLEPIDQLVPLAACHLVYCGGQLSGSPRFL